MCHTTRIEYFGEFREPAIFSAEVEGLHFGSTDAGITVAVLPDIYGLTDFYKGYASYLAGLGANVFLTNPWSPFGDLPEPTREAAYARRHKLHDMAHCNQLDAFIGNNNIQAIVGFCIGGNFAFEMARRGYEGKNIAVYPLPWGMPNQDEIKPAFEYMSSLEKPVTILMGEADHLAGPDNIEKLKTATAANPALTLHLYPGSNHGFFTDIDGSDAALKQNARAGIDRVNEVLF
jgi:carboxymethylenebutenolidase